MNQRTLKLFFLTIAVLAEISCGSKTDKENATSSEINSPSLVDPDSKGGNKCLLAFSERLDKLLPLELAAELVRLPAGLAKVKYSTVMKNPAYHSIKYSWKSDRKRNMKELGINSDVPVDNHVELHGLKETTLKNFKLAHSKPTSEQLRQRDEQIDKALRGESGNKSVDEKIERLEKMNVDKKTQKSTTSSLTNVFTKVAMTYEDVPDLADAAAWNAASRRLYVLDNGVELSLSVDLSNDDEVNKEKAISFARKLLGNCE